MTSWFRPLLTQIFKRMFLGIKAVDELWDDGPLGPDMSPSSHRSKRLKLKETQKDYKCHSCIICSCYVSVSCCFACVWSFVTYLRYLLIVCVSLQSLCVSLSLSLQLFCIVMVFLLCCSFVCVFFCGHFVSLSSLPLKLFCDSLHHFVSFCVSFESFFSHFEVALWLFASFCVSLCLFRVFLWSCFVSLCYCFALSWSLLRCSFVSLCGHFVSLSSHLISLWSCFMTLWYCFALCCVSLYHCVFLCGCFASLRSLLLFSFVYVSFYFL